MAGIMDFIGGIFKPAADLIDNVHTSDEEKGKLKNEFAVIQDKMLLKVLDYEKQLMLTKGKLLNAEVTNGNWLTRSWRPIVMLTFLWLTVADQYMLLPKELSHQAWTLLEIGLGGYVVGRSVEKAAPAVAKILKK